MSRTPLAIGLAVLLAGAAGGLYSAAAAQPGTATTLAALQAASGPSAAAAPLPAVSSFPSQPKFLPADQVFRVGATAAGAGAIRLDWWIRDGYYLYRSRLKVAAGNGVTLGALTLPAGQIKMDPYFGREEIYRNAVSGTVAVQGATGAGARSLSLQVTYQGCADAGLCYPPITKTLAVALPPAGSAATGAGGSPASSAASAPRSATPGQQGHLSDLVRSGSLLAMIGWFYLAGLGLAFTGCVYPTIPILSGIIVGQGRKVTTSRAFALSLAYVLGMALTYTIAGTAFAALGGQAPQAAFQSTWIVASFAALFVAMALSMLGLYTVQIPAALQTRIANLSNRQTAGTIGGVAIMGALSALLVTTCVGPALVAALAVISQTGEIARGASALFAMCIGMGTPLLVIGTSAGRLLPKSGSWMDTIKRLFAAVMLGVAVWMLGRLLPPRLTLALWAVPVATVAVVLLIATRSTVRSRWPLRFGALAAGLYGLTLVTGAALGGTSPLAPLPAWASTQPPLPFAPVRTVADLDRQVAQASRQGHPVMIDFTADWCTSCKEMEATTFLDPTVRKALSGAILLRADVTADDADDKALLKRLGIIGPPTIAFFGRDGQERPRYRVVGYMNGAEFAAAAQAAFDSQPAS
ncbi:MAG TPA: protein-disulfide reductase DsbD [Steroidobacteraceae bacterium]|nr:protein-disulfide reductase DsbD [Steroidobacteraceae bacterium]